MKKLLFIIFCFISLFNAQAQVILGAQNFETTSPANNMTFKVFGSGGTAGGFTGKSPMSYYSSDSPYYSDGVKGYGMNDGSRVIDFDPVNTLGYSNITLSYKIAAFATINTQGLDVTDNVSVSVSVDGVTYEDQIIVRGNTNAYWTYDATGLASTNYITGGLPTVFSPNTTPGLHTTDGMSTVELTNLPETRELYIRLTVTNNKPEEIWTVDKLRLTGSAIVLPVDMRSFTLQNEGANERLEWITAYESNTDGFIVERGKTQYDFSQIGIVKAIGAGGYMFVDKNPMSGVSYYRIKMMDMDGNFHYSKIESASRVSKKWQIYPTLATDFIVLEKTEVLNKNPIIKIVDISSKEIFSQQIDENGDSTVKISLNNLSKGMYFIKIGDQTEKFFKM